MKAAPVQRPAPHRVHPPHAPRGRTWAGIGLVLGTVAALGVFAPAQWLATVIERASAGQVLLAQARGTLWTGSAQWVFTGGAGSQDRVALPGRIHWQLRPHWTGLDATLTADCCTRSSTPLALTLTPRWGGAQIAWQDSQSQWPAALLSGLGTPWNTLQLQGQMVLQTHRATLQWTAGRVHFGGQLQLDAQAISSRLSTLQPMGSYRLQLQGGETPTLQLQTLEGHLLLSGNGQWVGRRLRFSGEAQAAPKYEAQLSNLLNIIGRRNGARAIITLG